jgi:hypothetical protein
MDVLSVLKFIDGYVASFDHVLINNLICLALAISAMLNRKDSNILFVISLILIPKLFDILILNKILLSGLVPNCTVFLIYSIYDGIVLFLILDRLNIMRTILILKLKLFGFFNVHNKTLSFNYARHVNEYKIIVVFIISIIINILVAAEYPTRWYISNEILYFYYLYSPLKFGLNIALIYWVLTMRSDNQINKGVY